MHVRGRHWALALLGAVLAHAGVAAAILWQPPRSGAVGAGMGGVEVALGPAGGAPGGEARPVETVEEAEAAEVPTTAPTDIPADEAAVEPPETVPPEPVEPVEAEAAEPRAAPVETVLAEPATPAEVTETTPVEDAIEVADKPPIEETQAETPETPAATAPPEPVTATAAFAPPLPRRKPTPRGSPSVLTEPEPVRAPPPPAAATTEPRPEQVAKVEPSVAGAGGKAGTEARPEAGSADAASGGGMPGETVDYMARLQAWLNKHKEYPRRAQLRRQEGTALLYFVMDREGRVIEYRLRQSSGHGLLDREVEAMIERAQPLPKMPDSMSQQRLELVVPVRFALR
jgi:protein TonB